MKPEPRDGEDWNEVLSCQPPPWGPRPKEWEQFLPPVVEVPQGWSYSGKGSSSTHLLELLSRCDPEQASSVV